MDSQQEEIRAVYCPECYAVFLADFENLFEGCPYCRGFEIAHVVEELQKIGWLKGGEINVQDSKALQR